MLINKFLKSLFVFISLCVFSSTSFAANHLVVGKITTMLTASSYSGCMIHLDVATPEVCTGGGWVALDCNGGYYDPVIGNNKYSTALTAFSLDKRVRVSISDTKKTPEGYCVAYRLDVYR